MHARDSVPHASVLALRTSHTQSLTLSCSLVIAFRPQADDSEVRLPMTSVSLPHVV